MEMKPQQKLTARLLAALPLTVWLAVLLGGTTLLVAGCGMTSSATVSADGAVTPVSVSDSSAEQTITLIGASTPYPALALLADAYSQGAKSTTDIVFLDSSQSSGGIEAVKKGLADLGTVTRSPKPKEADDQLTYRAIARDALVVATHPSVTGIHNLTTQDLQNIYSGQATNWKDFGGPDADIVVLDRAEDTSAKRLLRKYYLTETLSNAPNAIVLDRESDIIDALQSTPHSIGTLSLAKATTQNLPINRLRLDGIEPTAQNVASDEYPMHRTLGLVWYATPAATTQDFIAFISSAAGSTALQKAGFTPISFAPIATDVAQ
ncbi:MAG: substrate-binding domain-containing protein [Cyanobacteria bacterium J06598_3]